MQKRPERDSILSRQLHSGIRKSLLGAVAAVLAAIFLTGCSTDIKTFLFPENGTSSTSDSSVILPEEDENGEQMADTGFVVYAPGDYDSADTPILVSKNTDERTLTFLNLDLGKRYTLSYDGTSCFYDAFGQALTLDQISVGDIVDVTFIKSKKHLTTLNSSGSAWTFDGTSQYVIDSIKKEITIGTDTYKISGDALFFSEGREIEEKDISEMDRLSFQGIGNKIYSTTVTSGHGYLRLNGQENFVGGWLELGSVMVVRISEDMLFTVPEGSYQVNVSIDGTNAVKNVKILRSQETLLDLSDIKIEAPKSGTVLFSLNPSDATLYIDGEKANPSQGIELTYGLHQLICRANGYQTVTQYLRVGSPSAGIDIVLEAVDSSDSDSSSGSDSSDSSSDSSTTGSSSDGSDSSAASGSDSNSTGSASDGSSTDATDSSSTVSGDADLGDPLEIPDNANSVTTGYYRVYIDAPENVTVYLDGSYVGVTPCSFKKQEGIYELTLSKEGYETRSYTIAVDNEDKDISFSFVNLNSLGTN